MKESFFESVNFSRGIYEIIHLAHLILHGKLAHTYFRQVAFQSNANHPLAESMGYIKFEGM